MREKRTFGQNGVGSSLRDGRVGVVSRSGGCSRGPPARVVPPLGNARLFAERRARLVHLVALGEALGGGMGISASRTEHDGVSSLYSYEVVKSWVKMMASSLEARKVDGKSRREESPDEK